MQITVFADPSCDPADVAELARGQTNPSAEVAVLTDPENLIAREGGEGHLHLLHVPAGRELSLERADLLGRRAGPGPIGVLSEDEGLVLTRAGRGEFARFARRRSDQADAGVYLAGADMRANSRPGEQLPLPRQVYLGLTQRCNRSCSFCVSRTFAADMLTVEEVRRVAQELAGEVDVVALTGAGEAMVHPDFWEILDMLVETLPGVVFKMNTSGIALRHNAARLVEYPVKNITVSLNAGTQDTYERFVGRGFKAALRGIETLVTERARAGRADLRLCLSLVLMESTVAEVEDVVRIAFELGIEEVQGIYLMVNDETLADESPWHRPEESNAHLDRAERLARTLGVEVSLPPRFREMSSARGTSQKTSLPTSQGQKCVEPWSTVYVRPDGELLPCPYFEESLGSVREGTLAEAWRGEAFENLRAGILSGAHCEECRHCCGFNEGGSVDDYASHWIGTRGPERVHT